MNMGVSIADVLRVRKLTTDEYISAGLVAPWKPVFARGTFGGHVLAQSAYTAAKTVPSGFYLHGISSYFLAPGANNEPFVYKVHRLRTGRGFATRVVEVYQKTLGCCFTCTCSFTRPQKNIKPSTSSRDDYKSEDGLHYAQPPPNYIENPPKPDPMKYPLAPAIDYPPFLMVVKEENFKEEDLQKDVPVTMRKIDLSEYNNHHDIQDRRTVHYIKAHPLDSSNKKAHDEVKSSEDEEKTDEDETSILNVCALLYASDRNSLFTLIHHLAIDNMTMLASISHTVFFHIEPTRTDKQWHLLETWTERGAGERGMLSGHIWDEEGVMVATLVQEGLLRMDYKL